MLHPCRTALRVGTLLALAFVGAATLCRLVGFEPGPLTWVVSLTPWVGLTAVVVLVVAAASRSVVLVVVAAVVVAAQVGFQVPLFRSDPAPGGGELVVMTSNLRFGEADPGAVLALIHRNDVDVLALQELTPEAVRALRAAGLERALPYSVARPSSGAAGTGLWSRFPLTRAQAFDGFVFEQVLARARTPLGTLTLGSLHPAAPSAPRWRDEVTPLGERLAGVAGPLLVAGDFNATWDNASFRSLLDLGFVDAADQAGSGLQFTWPTTRGPLPFVAIDHTLVRGTALVATSVTIVRVPGTDHATVVVRYAG